MRYLAGLFLALLALQAPTRTYAQEHQEPHTRSVAVGVGIALANTIVPIAVGDWMDQDTEVSDWVGGLLLAYGWVVGPFPGNVYAKDTRRGLIGMGIRTGGLLVALGSSIENTELTGLTLAFGVVSLATTVWNTWTIPSSVRRYNESLSVGPTIQPDGSFGLQVMLRW